MSYESRRVSLCDQTRTHSTTGQTRTDRAGWTPAAVPAWPSWQQPVEIHAGLTRSWFDHLLLPGSAYGGATPTATRAPRDPAARAAALRAPDSDLRRSPRRRNDSDGRRAAGLRVGRPSAAPLTDSDGHGRRPSRGTRRRRRRDSDSIDTVGPPATRTLSVGAGRANVSGNHAAAPCLRVTVTATGAGL